MKSLQRLLASSRVAKLLAIRKVGQENSGRKTPGIDGVVSNSDRDRVRLFQDGLSLKDYAAAPVRRVFIPKANGKQRPLGIPTMKDRVMVKLALDGIGATNLLGVRGKSFFPHCETCRRQGKRRSSAGSGSNPLLAYSVGGPLPVLVLRRGPIVFR